MRGHLIKLKIESQNAPNAVGPYSQAIAFGNMVFTSGQIPLTKEGKVLEESVEEQAHQVMKNLEAVLKEAGCTFDDVVKTTIFLTDMADYAKVNQAYASRMTEPFPARETIGVKQLPLGAKVEISMIAIKSSSSYISLNNYRIWHGTHLEKARPFRIQARR